MRPSGSKTCRSILRAAWRFGSRIWLAAASEHPTELASAGSRAPGHVSRRRPTGACSCAWSESRAPFSAAGAARTAWRQVGAAGLARGAAMAHAAELGLARNDANAFILNSRAQKSPSTASRLAGMRPGSRFRCSTIVSRPGSTCSAFEGSAASPQCGGLWMGVPSGERDATWPVRKSQPRGQIDGQAAARLAGRARPLRDRSCGPRRLNPAPARAAARQIGRAPASAPGCRGRPAATRR